MMMKKTAKLFTVVLVICAMLMSMISTTLVSAEEANLPEAIGEEVTSVETIETEEPAAEEPEAEEPAAEEPAADEPAADEPVAEEPAADEPVANEPVADEPVADEPVADEPVADEPVANEPVADEPVANEPVADEPVANVPVVVEPVVDEPVADEPVADEPVADEPVAEEPVEEEKEFTQMFVNGAATVYENPVVDEEHEVCKMQDGESIEVCRYDEDWFEVKTGGYIMKENLRLEANNNNIEEKQIVEEPVAEESAAEEPVAEEPVVEEPATVEPAAEETSIVTPLADEPEEGKDYTWMFIDGDTTIYARPEAIEENAICEIQNGEPVRVYEYNQDWYRAKTGYIMKANICAEAKQEAAEEQTTQEPVNEPETVAAGTSEEEAAEEQESEEEDLVSFEDYETPLGIPGAPVFDYERDENGALVLDEKGNPIAIRESEDDEIPVAFLRDENGELVLDRDGNPVVTQTVPADAMIVNTLEDALDPNRYIDIYASWNNEKPKLGGTVTFVAVPKGYDNLLYTVNWQQSPDNVTWTDIPEAEELRYNVVVTVDNYSDYWRAQLVITGAREPINE